MNIGQYIFARLYGYMLGRTYRNTPTEACSDAITPYMIIIGVPATLVALVFLMALFPRLLTTKDWIPWVTVSSGILLYFLFRPLQRYAHTPEIGVPFSSPSSRRITMACYVGVLLGSVLAAAIAGRFLLHAIHNR